MTKSQIKISKAINVYTGSVYKVGARNKYVHLHILCMYCFICGQFALLNFSTTQHCTPAQSVLTELHCTVQNGGGGGRPCLR